MPPKRERTVKGSCWPCKQRRVKCDLGKPLCQRCISSGAKCCYDKVLIRWKETPPTTRSLSMCQSRIMSLNIHLKDNTLSVGDLRALEYFQFAVWPLFTTAAHPCPPPIPLAMECQPVFLAVCELAEAHRTLRDKAGSSTASSPFDKRMSCLASVREQLRNNSNHTSLSPLLVAVFLLYFLDGFIECDRQSASTASHHVGVQAIVDHLGGFSALIKIGQKDITMLLSEFASTDLTKALLDDRPPCFPAEIWTQIEHGTVWWDQETYNGTTLASVFRIMSEMSLYRQQIRGDPETLSMEVVRRLVRRFERCLQPSYQILNCDHLENPSTYTVHESTLERRMQADSFTRAFQHSALVYLYRAICGLPPRHSLVQQHVQSCVECIRNISPLSKAHNCIIFPLYIMGAHTFLQDQQVFVLERLDSIYKYLRFNCVLLVRAALEDLWKSPRHDGDWWGMFRSLGEHVLVI